eukprot:snap_masked-scaffold_6-processed-gene-14.33-mRNA-1 protein AED:0.06 eAED:0.06 QI:0/-1/0/1/-1/1/1/0/269
MSTRIAEAFAKNENPIYIPCITGGYPTKEDTVPLLLALQNSGAGIIELVVPFSDPIADGPVIQKASFDALQNGTTLQDCISFVKEARVHGLKVPVILMSYYNPVLAFGEEQIVAECKKPEVDVNGFIIVDTDFNDFIRFGKTCSDNGLSLIPLVAPTTTDERLEEISKAATGFVYCVSVTGVTGQRKDLSSELPVYCARVKKAINLPRALGFGISSHEHIMKVKEEKYAEGCIMCSRLITLLKESYEEGDVVETRAKKLEDFARQVIEG